MKMVNSSYPVGAVLMIFPTDACKKQPPLNSLADVVCEFVVEQSIFLDNWKSWFAPQTDMIIT